MKYSMRVSSLLFSFIALAALGWVAAPAWAAEQSAEDIAKAAQNPVADMISLPFQNNTNFNVGPENGVQNVLNIQPVIPIHLAPNWHLITRTIFPVISQPPFGPGQNTQFGLGDTFFSAFLSPAKPGGFFGGWVP